MIRRLFTVDVSCASTAAFLCPSTAVSHRAGGKVSLACLNELLVRVDILGGLAYRL